MSLSSDQLTDMQADIGIGSDESVFTDDELNRLYARADSSYDLAVLLALRQLLINAVKLNDYTAGQTSEKKSQIFDHLKQAVEYWEEQVVGAGNQVAIIGMEYVPRTYREEPSEAISERKRRPKDVRNARF